MKISRTYDFVVLPGEKDMRADAFLASRIPGLSRSALTAKECEIYINGKEGKKSDKVREKDEVLLIYNAEVFESVEPQDIPLDILYEDKNMLVINKAQGMVVHPGAGNIKDTVVNALAFRYGQSLIDEMADECDVSRPGIVHRLDKDTSGVLVVALTASAHASLSAQFQNREVKKIYRALCDGVFSLPKGNVECLMGRDKNNRKLFCPVVSGGKESRSSYTVLNQYRNFAEVDVRIYTGRTHQIRVHMKSIKHPVIGDVLYNPAFNRFPGSSLMLHSRVLKIKHPVTGEEMLFEAPVPERFTEFKEKYGVSV